MKRFIFVAGLMLAPVTAFAQYAKPPGVPQTVLPGNVNAAVFASAQLLDGSEFVGLFEQHADTHWYYTGLGTVPTVSMSIVIAQAGGVMAYLANVALPAINADIQQVYYGQSAPPVPPPGADPLDVLNYNLATAFVFKALNNVQTLTTK